MKTEKVDVFKIELEGDEAKHFKEAMKKVVDENNRAGFTQVMTPERKEDYQRHKRKAVKISEMNREQLRDYIMNSAEINRLDPESKAWQRAFELAKESGYGDLDIGCHSCWQKVERFIREEKK